MKKKPAPKIAKEPKNKKAVPHEDNYKKARHKVRALTRMLGDAVIPQKYRTNLLREFELAGIQREPYLLYGMISWAVIALAIITSAVVTDIGVRASVPILLKLLVWAVFTPMFVLAFLLVAKWILRKVLDARIYHNVREMEKAFPDFLAEVNLNLKAGSNLKDALQRAAQEDFGPLSEDMRRLTTEVELGFDLEESLREAIESYNSDFIQESFELVLISWKTGGDTPKLVDRVVENMKVMHNLRDKVVASVSNYKIFILTVTAMLAPAMLALAFHVIDLVREITTQVIESTTGSALPIALNAVRFDDTHFIWFSVLTLVIIGTFSAFISTYIESGNIKGSAPTVSKYVISSLAVYAVAMVLFAEFFTFFAV